jgi:hypothetical protein
MASAVLLETYLEDRAGSLGTFGHRVTGVNAVPHESCRSRLAADLAPSIGLAVLLEADPENGVDSLGALVRLVTCVDAPREQVLRVGLAACFTGLRRFADERAWAVGLDVCRAKDRHKADSQEKANTGRTHRASADTPQQ